MKPLVSALFALFAVFSATDAESATFKVGAQNDPFVRSFDHLLETGDTLVFDQFDPQQTGNITSIEVSMVVDVAYGYAHICEGTENVYVGSNLEFDLAGNQFNEDVRATSICRGPDYYVSGTTSYETSVTLRFEGDDILGFVSGQPFTFTMTQDDSPLGNDGVNEGGGIYWVASLEIRAISSGPIAPVPLPASGVLLLLGACSFAGLRRKAA